MHIQANLPGFLIRWILLAAFVSCQIHMYVDAGVRQCFYRDLTVDSVLLGTYKMEILDGFGEFVTPKDKHNTGVIVDVEEVFLSNDRVVHQRGSFSGRFSFSPLEQGLHRICLTPKLFYKRKWREENEQLLQELKFERARVTLDLATGDASRLFPEDPAEIEELTSRIVLLVEKVSCIKREQSFIRAKEAGFRDLLERACARVVTWLVTQLGVVLVAFLCQLWMLIRHHMKRKVHID